MALFTVHVPEHVADQVERADRTIFVREGFALWGLVFGCLYLIWYRLWWALLVWLLLATLLATAWWTLRLPAEPLILLFVLMNAFVGVEGSDLRRWSLQRRGYWFADVVSGRRSVAEYAFFLRQPQDETRSRATPAPRFVQRDYTPSVIGMFPDGGTA